MLLLACIPVALMLIAGPSVAADMEPPPAEAAAPAMEDGQPAPAMEEGPAEPAPDIVNPDYVIGPGDALLISVWKDPELTRSVVVLPDGAITFPLIGRVMCSEKTVNALSEELIERIGRFVPDPIVTVEVQAVNSMVIYIIGRVNGPGRVALNANVNVLQALAIAGGLNPFAKKDRIRIFRNDAGVSDILLFNYDEVAAGEKLDQNILLKRGDVIVVP